MISRYRRSKSHSRPSPPESCTTNATTTTTTSSSGGGGVVSTLVKCTPNDGRAHDWEVHLERKQFELLLGVNLLEFFQEYERVPCADCLGAIFTIPEESRTSALTEILAALGDLCEMQGDQVLGFVNAMVSLAMMKRSSLPEIYAALAWIAERCRTSFADCCDAVGLLLDCPASQSCDNLRSLARELERNGFRGDAATELLSPEFRRSVHEYDWEVWYGTKAKRNVRWAGQEDGETSVLFSLPLEFNLLQMRSVRYKPCRDCLHAICQTRLGGEFQSLNILAALDLVDDKFDMEGDPVRGFVNVLLTLVLALEGRSSIIFFAGANWIGKRCGCSLTDIYQLVRSVLGAWMEETWAARKPFTHAVLNQIYKQLDVG